nr:hypothetical protein CFP56_63547 [Quercus suber]
MEAARTVDLSNTVGDFMIILWVVEDIPPCQKHADGETAWDLADAIRIPLVGAVSLDWGLAMPSRHRSRTGRGMHRLQEWSAAISLSQGVHRRNIDVGGQVSLVLWPVLRIWCSNGHLVAPYKQRCSAWCDRWTLTSHLDISHRHILCLARGVFSNCNLIVLPVTYEHSNLRLLSV